MQMSSYITSSNTSVNMNLKNILLKDYLGKLITENERAAAVRYGEIQSDTALRVE